MSLDANGQAAGATILLVDDEEGVRMYCRRILEDDGASVVEASNGEAALRLLENGDHGVDVVVVTDLLMPLISGREVAEVLAAFRPDLRVLAISADPGAQSDRRLPILRKPFTPDELLDAVAQVRLRARDLRARAQEKRARAQMLHDAAVEAQRRAKLCARIDLVAAVIELRRITGAEETASK